jgi:uncharacterized membrane protein HdeD (DUF308 family)
MDGLVTERIAGILSRNWWVLLLRGVVAILFGAMTYLQPGISIASLVLLFGAYSMADGILGAYTAIAGRKEREHWWVLLLEGFVGIGIGILTLFAPGVTALALLFYIAVWAISTGLLEIVAAVRLRKEIEGEWLLVLGGLASVVFGVLLLANPGAGALTVVWLIGAYAIAFGVVLCLLAFKARSFGKNLAAGRAA